MFVRYSTPGNTFPSSNSNDAPPPVDTWLNYAADPFYEPINETVSPPPAIVVAPFLVYLIIASSIDIDPRLKGSNSNAP